MPCTTILVGKRASNDSSTMISRTDDGHFDVKKLVVVEPKDQKRKYKSVISHLVVAADTLSAARPGARSETLETYTKRITQLEEIAKGYEGVQQAYAMQAGREIRVMVVPERVSDADAVRMAQQLREQIETTMTYPGQIKVSVIREYRANELAK